MDLAGMLAAFAADPNVVTQFQAFLATQVTNAPDSSNVTAGSQNPAVNRSSDPAERSDEGRTHSSTGDNPRGRSPTIGRSSDPAEPSEQQRGRSRTPRYTSPSNANRRPERQAFSPEHRVSHDHPTTPSRSPSQPRPKSPAPGGRRQTSRTQTASPDPPGRRGKAPVTSPCHPRSPSERRSTSPRPQFPRDHPSRDNSRPTRASRSRSKSPSNKRRSRSASPRPGPPKRQRKHTQPPEDETEDPYDICPTSYERRPGKRGGRVKTLIDGKNVIQRTPMEKLVERAKKHKQVVRKGHLFGKKHGCYFNPYTFNKVNEKTCVRIPRPPGFQIGRGGTQPLHELIGLRDDYDTFCDIRGVIRKACLKWRPQNIDLPPGKGVTWKHYSSSARVKIHNYVYSHFPALFHFRNESGEDSWVVASMAAAYLASNRAYTKTGAEAKRNNHLRRNASGPKRQRDDDADDDGYGSDDDEYDENGEIILPSPEKAPTGYDDDYGHNAQSRSDRTSTGGAGPSRSHKRTRSRSPQTTSRDKYDDEPRPKKGKGPSASRSSSPARQPAEPSQRDIRRAEKTVANEADRDKDLGASRNKAGGSKPVAPSKTKETPAGRKEPVAPSKPTDQHEDGEDDDDDDEPIRTITKRVIGRKAPVKPKDGPAKQKQSAAKSKKPTGNKEPTPEPETEEEPAPKKKRANPKMRPVPPESEPEQEPGPSKPSASSTENPQAVGTMRIPVGLTTRGQARAQK